MENHHVLFIGKSTIAMAMFNSYVCLSEGIDVSGVFQTNSYDILHINTIFHV